MMSRFNTNMYDHKGAQPTAPTVVPDQREEIEEDDNEELIQVLNDVEELFGQPVFSLRSLYCPEMIVKH